MNNSLQPIDLTHSLLPVHQGKWVVMSRESRKVFSYDDRPKKALEKAVQAGCKDPILHKVLPFDKAFALFLIIK